jgi:hypothetical protein
MGEGAFGLRLLVGFILVFAALSALQIVHPECSMTDLVGVEWVACLLG